MAYKKLPTALVMGKRVSKRILKSQTIQTIRAEIVKMQSLEDIDVA